MSDSTRNADHLHYQGLLESALKKAEAKRNEAQAEVKRLRRELKEVTRRQAITVAALKAVKDDRNNLLDRRGTLLEDLAEVTQARDHFRGFIHAYVGTICERGDYCEGRREKRLEVCPPCIFRALLAEPQALEDLPLDHEPISAEAEASLKGLHDGTDPAIHTLDDLEPQAPEAQEGDDG